MPSECLVLQRSLLVLIDAAGGPLKTVRSIAPDELRVAVECLAQGASLLRLPVLQLHAPFAGAAAVPIVNSGSAVRHTANDANLSINPGNAKPKRLTPATGG